MSSEKNTTFKLRLSAKASKYLLRLDKKTATRLLNKMEILKHEPFSAPGVKPLTGRFSGLYRLRIGSYRVIYKIEKDDRIVIILVIGPRRDVYRNPPLKTHGLVLNIPGLNVVFIVHNEPKSKLNSTL